MTNPLLPTISESDADSIQNTNDAGLGIPYTRHGHDPNDTPPVETVMTQWQRFIATLLGGGEFSTSTNTPGSAQGHVAKVATLTIRALACKYLYAGAAKSFAGGSLLLTAAATNYVYLDADATLKASTSSFPASAWRLAVVTCGASDITAIEDRRFQNFDPAGTANWWNTPADGNVSLYGSTTEHGIGYCTSIHYKQATVTIQADAGSGDFIEQTGLVQLLRTIGGAGTGDLEQIDPLDAYDASTPATFIILRANDSGSEVVTVKDNSGGGNIRLLEGDFVLDDDEKTIMLWYEQGGDLWYEVSRNKVEISTLVQNMDADGYSITNIGKLNLGAAAELTLASGAVDYDDAAAQSNLKIDTESDAATDDLDTISNGDEGDLIIVRGVSAARNVVVKHGTGNILLHNGRDCTLDTLTDTLVLYFGSPGVWYEVSRSNLQSRDLVDTGDCIPLPLHAHFPGAVSSGTQTWSYIAQTDYRIDKFSAYVQTAPSGGPCIVNLLVNGSAVYASEANAANITDGTNSDDSASTSPTFTGSAGDRIEISVSTSSGSPNSAADLTVSIGAYAAVQTEPDN